MLLVKKFNFFLYFFSLKQGLKISINDVLDRKQTFFDDKDKNFKSHKNHIFPKELIYAFGQKMQNFSLFRFGQNKTRNKV